MAGYYYRTSCRSRRSVSQISYRCSQKAQSLPEVEVIVLTRGGGSLEDLWSFNDENLIREMSLCEIPLISAVGHQVDYTLSDYVAIIARRLLRQQLKLYLNLRQN